MKSIRIVNTIRHFEEQNKQLALIRIQEILSEHRTILCQGILNDLTSYLDFKFYAKVEPEIQRTLRERLLELSNSKVNLNKHQNIVRDIEDNDIYRVPDDEFFEEIDSLIDSVLNPKQLTFI